MGGIWSFLVARFSDLIQLCYQLSDGLGLANYGLAIIFMTIFIKVVLFPLTNTQLKSMRAMQELQPKMKEVQARYKDNPEKLNTELMKLYKENNVNPMSGCLPLLVQFPILIAFYQALIKFKYVVPSHAVFLWVPNLSQNDPYILPLLAGLTTFIQQKLSMVDSKDPTQRSMMIFMPLFIAWMAHNPRFPAGLTLYWVVFNILSIMQQAYVNFRHQVKVAADTGPGQVVVDVENESPVESEKGGTKNEGRRKKRKKRR